MQYNQWSDPGSYRMSTTSNSGTHNAIVTQEDPVQRLYLDIDLNHRRVDVQVKMALAEKSIAEAFQIKAQTLLWGLNEIRLALNFAQIDSTKEAIDPLDKDKIPLKGIFSTEEQQSSLRVRYINQLDLYLRYVRQIDPEQK